MLSGCAVIPADISELESPPKLTKEQQAIESALENKVGNKLTLKYPLDGDYRSAFILRDIDHDGTTEAFACYSPSNGAAGPHISFLGKVNGKWKVISDIDSGGSEIDCISFGDFNGDGTDEIAVGWRSFNSTDMNLLVYSESSKGGFVKANLGSFTEIKTLDMTQDGKPDILLLKLDSDEKLAAARLISYRDGKLEQVAQAPLDSTVSGYAGVFVTKLDNNSNGILVDGYKSSHNSMITELVYYKDGKLLTPFFDKNEHTVLQTLRSSSFECLDIDNDGSFEIPMPISLPYVPDKKNDNQNWLINWSVFSTKKGLTQKIASVVNYSENYYFIYPKKWDYKVTVNKINDNNWQFCVWDYGKLTYGKSLFSIQVYSEDAFSSIPNKSNLFTLSEKSGTVYTVELPQQQTDKNLSLSLDEIRKDFKLFNQ